MILAWRNAERTVLAKAVGDHTVIIEPGHPEWAQLSKRPDIAEYVDPADPRAEIRAQRQAAFMAEADPLFFQAQRGEATMDEWWAKVAEIRARLPYPDE